MDYKEKEGFIESVLKGLWPDWEPKDAETRVWLWVLSKFDYEIAKVAAEQYFSEETGNWKRPKPAKFIAKANVLLQRAGKSTPQEERKTDTYVYCQEHAEKPERIGWEVPIFTLKLKDQYEPDYVSQAAEQARQQHEEVYGGHWITIKKQPLRDDGLRGAAAKKQAEENVLAGPVFSGQRWLLKLIEYRANPKEALKKKSSNEPVRLGELLEEPPF